MREYSQEKGKFIAEHYADGETLRSLSKAFPEFLPPAMYIKQWRNEYPAFNQLMQIAAAALADVKIEEAETVAGDLKRPAAHAANTIKIKLAQAAALDSQVYGNKRIIAGDKDNPLKVQAVKSMTDEELMTLARGGVVHVGHDEHAETVNDPPAPPLSAEGRASVREVRDTTLPPTTSPKDSVTTQEDDIKMSDIFEKVGDAFEENGDPKEAAAAKSTAKISKLAENVVTVERVIVSEVARRDAIDPGF